MKYLLKKLKGAVAWSMSYALDQQMIQRFSAAKNTRTAQLALMLNMPGSFLLITICCLTGLVMYANFSSCDPLSTGQVSNPNQLLPFFVMLKFNNIIFIPGLFLSSVFCASLSSVSSALNSMSACIWRDYLLRIKYFEKADDDVSARVTKIIALLCGLVCTGMGFLISRLDSNLIQISGTINGALQSPLIGIFFLSSMFPIANIYGLFAGALSGFGVGVWLGLGAFLTKPYYPKLPLNVTGCDLNVTMPMPTNATSLTGFNKVYSLSFMWLSPVGVFTVILIGLLVSWSTKLILKIPDKKLDDSLILYRFHKTNSSK